MSKLKRRLAGVGTGLLAGYLLGKSGFGSKPAKGATKKTITSKSKIVKDPTTEGLRITRSKPFESQEMGPTSQDRSVSFDSPTEATYIAMPRTPVGFEYEQGIEGTFGPMAKDGKFINQRKMTQDEIDAMEEYFRPFKPQPPLPEGSVTSDTKKKDKFMRGGKVKKAKIGMFGKVETKSAAVDKETGDRMTLEDMIAAGNIVGTISPYLKKRDKDRLNKDIEKAQKNFYKERNKDLTATEGSFMRGGSVVARGDKFSRNRSRPTKLS